MICLGDFNLPNLAWVPGENIVDYVPVSSIELSTEMSSFWENLFEQCLYQINSTYNAKGKLLDLIFSSSITSSVCRRLPFSEPEDMYHPTLLVAIELLNIQTENTSSRKSRVS